MTLHSPPFRCEWEGRAGPAWTVQASGSLTVWAKTIADVLEIGCRKGGKRGRSERCAPPERDYLPPMPFLSSFLFSSSALLPLESFFSFCSAGAGSFAKLTGAPTPSARNAANTIRCAKRVISNLLVMGKERVSTGDIHSVKMISEARSRGEQLRCRITWLFLRAEI